MLSRSERWSRDSGFTMLEALVAIFLTLIVMASVFALLGGGGRELQRSSLSRTVVELECSLEDDRGRFERPVREPIHEVHLGQTDLRVPDGEGVPGAPPELETPLEARARVGESRRAEVAPSELV